MLGEVRELRAGSWLGALPGVVAHREAERGDAARPEVRGEGVPRLVTPRLGGLVRACPQAGLRQAAAAGFGYPEIDEHDLVPRPGPEQRALQCDVEVRHAPRVQPAHRAQQREGRGPGPPLALRPRRAQTAGEPEQAPARQVLRQQDDIAALVEEGPVAGADSGPRPARLGVAQGQREHHLGQGRLQAALAVVELVRRHIAAYFLQWPALRGERPAAEAVGVQLDRAAAPVL
mmetsp:Transcript_112335/g.312594  ORF Transcript_112335/g.312594 Transcript_112335/m.312594 type:complete len:232 (-) Transcript_112335:272-967(-)